MVFAVVALSMGVMTVVRLSVGTVTVRVMTVSVVAVGVVTMGVVAVRVTVVVRGCEKGLGVMPSHVAQNAVLDVASE